MPASLLRSIKRPAACSAWDHGAVNSTGNTVAGREDRFLLRQEAGAISISAVLLIGAVLILIYALLGASNGDPDKYGRAPIPSTARLTLPAEEIDISYAEVTAARDIPVQPPSDLRVVVREVQTGAPVAINARGGSQSEVSGEAVSPILAVRPPAEGVYEVESISNEAAGRRGPALLFGESPVGAVGDRFAKAGDLIASKYGGAAAILLLLAAMAPSFQRALKRRS